MEWHFAFAPIATGTGAFDAWLFPDKPAKTVQFTSASGQRGADWTFVAGDRVKSVAIPATSPDIISVAGYTTRNQWESAATPNCCMVAYDEGGIIDFSSSGPSADPNATGQKPEIAAPAGMVASALSGDAQPNGALLMDDFKHVLQAGTSMSAPFVTGTIALMFSLDPNFTHADARRYLIEGAAAEEGMGDLPGDRWGFGKLDTQATITAAIAGGATGNFAANGGVSAPPAESGGGSGCALAASSATGAGPAAALIWMLAMIPMAFRRRRSAPPLSS